MIRSLVEKREGLPGRWHAVLVAGFVIGIVLVTVNPPLPSEFTKLSSRVPGDAWSKLVGTFLMAGASTHWMVFFVLRGIRSLFSLSHPPRKNLWPPAVIGVCESVMYPISFIVGQADFMGFWLLLKVAGQWPRWGLKSEEDIEHLDEGRRRYVLFLIGNALMVMSGLATYGVLKVWVLN